MYSLCRFKLPNYFDNFTFTKEIDSNDQSENSNDSSSSDTSEDDNWSNKEPVSDQEENI